MHRMSITTPLERPANLPQPERVINSAQFVDFVYNSPTSSNGENLTKH